MCGRTACTLAPDQICKACAGNENRRYMGVPKWKNVPGDVGSYQPRYNLAPNVYSPILLGGHHFVRKNPKNYGVDHEGNVVEENDDDAGSNDGEETPTDEITADDLVIQPMRWGLVPSYLKEQEKFSYATINARAENITERQTYKVPLSKGRRCVVLVDGFYEWKRGPQGKQPYFIYFPQDKPIEWDHPENEDGGIEWMGRRLLTMAGVFEINRTGEQPLYTYTIVTIEVSDKLAWMHDRMPAILDGDQAVDDWLDSENVPMKEALKLLKPINNIVWHPVIQNMGNVRIQGPQCMVPLDETKTNPAVPSDNSKTILHYFKKTPKKDQSKSESSTSGEKSPPMESPPKDAPILHYFKDEEKSENDKTSEENGPDAKIPRQA